MKKTIAIILAVVLLWFSLTLPGSNTKVKALSNDYSVGDSVVLGSYPQSVVKETSFIAKLDTMEKNWISYNYFAGNGELNSAYQQSYMYYAELNYYGDRYRAVRIDNYRPYKNSDFSAEEFSYQDDNGYFNTPDSNIYYFKYEPLKWRVLDPSDGLLLCEYIIDSQAYNETTYFTGTDYLNTISGSCYACEWEGSTLRQWLNDDFFNTAFDATEQASIAPSQIIDYSLGGAYDGSLTTDNVFLLKHKDLENAEYALDIDENRLTKGTDYAKCQGLIKSDEDDKDEWRLRTAIEDSNQNCYVNNNGSICVDGIETCVTGCGIRPAIKLRFIPETFEFGSYPQSQVTDSRTIENLMTVVNNSSVKWFSYGYYYGTAQYQTSLYPFENPSGVASATQSDYMKYADFTYNGSKYRAVLLTRYRPCATYLQLSNTQHYQESFGYDLNTIYFFKYEPLTWRIIDPSTGLALCDNIIDSQPMYNKVYAGTDGLYYGDAALSYRVSNYSNSDLRKWLNDDFFNTAFNTAEQNCILVSTVDNTSNTGNNSEGSATTYDKIFILSDNEVNNTNYGFYDNQSRVAYASDYAKCQGVGAFGSTPKSSSWRLRTACSTVSHSIVQYNGQTNAINVCCTDVGIRPSMVVNAEPYIAIIRNGVNVTRTTISSMKNMTINLDGFNLGFVNPITENWLSSNPSVATVDNSGNVRTYSTTGTTEIKYTVTDALGQTLTASVIIKVHNLIPINIVYWAEIGLPKMLSGFTPGLSTKEVEDMINSSEEVSAVVCSEKKIIGTGTQILLETEQTCYEQFEAVIFGDANCDGWYDGTDAIIVNCIANGMLTREQVGDAVWLAADCNHDGVIDNLDVEILNNAGLLLAQVDQSASEEELETDSVYQEYLSLIDQSPIVEEETEATPSEEPVEEETTESFFTTIIALFSKLINYLMSLINANSQL